MMAPISSSSATIDTVPQTEIQCNDQTRENFQRYGILWIIAIVAIIIIAATAPLLVSFIMIPLLLVGGAIATIAIRSRFPEDNEVHLAPPPNRSVGFGYRHRPYHRVYRPRPSIPLYTNHTLYPSSSVHSVRTGATFPASTRRALFTGVQHPGLRVTQPSTLFSTPVKRATSVGARRPVARPTSIPFSANRPPQQQPAVRVVQRTTLPTGTMQRASAVGNRFQSNPLGITVSHSPLQRRATRVT